MDNLEILRQYATGVMNSAGALRELEKALGNTGTISRRKNAAEARYVIGFIRRAAQYRQGVASACDLCLNLRDLCRILGRIDVPDLVYDAALHNGQPFGLVCEGNRRISCVRSVPDWITPGRYVDECYSFYASDGEAASAGDMLLTSRTRFQTYKNYEQKLAVHTALELPPGFTLLISQPTGGGKSLVTQMLSVCTDGLTLVVVPTVALALDQYSAARENLIQNQEIYCYRGDQADSEKQTVIDAVKKRSAVLLFSSPEAIVKNNLLYQMLAEAAETGYLKNIVIDEAHIVPDWGVFFRPDFQIFSVILKKWRKLSQNRLRTYLLSATLSDDVVDTLFTLFGEKDAVVQFRCDSLRSEPRYYFYAVKNQSEREEKLLEALVSLPKPMVIYVLEPCEAEALRKLFIAHGYQNIPTFTGNTSDRDRARLLQNWKENRYDVILATSAFGIGVDKPDVRTIIHACVPENLSRYYQEVGRAGRDRLASISLLLPLQSRHDGGGDMRRTQTLVNKRVMTVQKMTARWAGLMNHISTYVDADVCVFDTSAAPPTMTYDEIEFAGNLNVSWNVNLLLFLHRTGFIELTDAFYQPGTSSYLMTAKIIKPEVFSSSETLAESLAQPREQEFNKQLAGYWAIRNLVQRPRSVCWGHAFRHLFPLAEELCGGCPADEKGRHSSESAFKLRRNPGIIPEPAPPSRRLERRMGIYNELLITCGADAPNLAEVRLVCGKASDLGIGTVVLPSKYMGQVQFYGIVLSCDEFYFSVIHTPYLFYKGVLCVFSDENSTNQALYRSLKRLSEYQYRRLLLCNGQMFIADTGKALIECTDGYSITPDQL